MQNLERGLKLRSLSCIMCVHFTSGVATVVTSSFFLTEKLKREIDIVFFFPIGVSIKKSTFKMGETFPPAAVERRTAFVEKFFLFSSQKGELTCS